jgi:hypothetical protein
MVQATPTDHRSGTGPPARLAGISMPKSWPYGRKAPRSGHRQHARSEAGHRRQGVLPRGVGPINVGRLRKPAALPMTTWSRPVYNRSEIDLPHGQVAGQNRTSGRWSDPAGGRSVPCQGEGRGFESGRPLSQRGATVWEVWCRRRRWVSHGIPCAGGEWRRAPQGRSPGATSPYATGIFRRAPRRGLVA